MDELDLRILKAIGRDHILGWGSLDPRLTAAALAAEVGVARSTVGGRLRAWEAEGFLVGFVALPHAALLGARLGLTSVFAPDPLKRRRLLEDIALADGYFGALDHQGGWLGVGILYEDEGALDRRLKRLARADGVEEAGPFLPWDLPPTKAQPSAVGWRIIQALVARPRGQVHELAADAGVSVRTFRRQYRMLIDENAVWLTPCLDFTRWSGPPLARLTITLAPGARGRDLDDALTRRHPLRMYVMAPPEPGPSDGTVPVDVVVPLDSPAALDDVAAELSAMEGVTDVEGLFPRRTYIFPQWFEARIAERVAASRS